ncbi:MAG: OB-fold domain-containing protein [Candidatus Schekmanbacteria bacterium]|nr:OB-fold domain-containing protein [Candidatus Schekmanbacteria bacterium]
MIGLTSFGAYIPQLRLKRMTIYQELGWFAPAIMAVAKGERAVCNWDEDSLSMAVEAGRNCLAGIDRAAVDGLFLCSTTLPYADRQNAAIASTALNLKEEIRTADFAASQRAATTGLISALDAVAAGNRRNVLVLASDRREARGASFLEMWLGDGAAAALIGTENVIAELVGSCSISRDLPDHYRGTGKRFDYTWEERWARDEGYGKLIPEVVAGLLARTGLVLSDFAKIVYPCMYGAEHAAIARRLGASAAQVMSNLHEETGETGAAHPLLLLARALEQAQPGDRILVVGFGQGADALAFRATEALRAQPARNGFSTALQQRRELDSYAKFAKFRELLELDMGIRGEVGGQTAMTALYRHRDMVLGLVGARCEVCGTAQFPRADICVNPTCGAVGRAQPYPFAERTARIVMFTGDYLAVSVDPPAIYGLVQFEGGGRMLADFTDCRLDDVGVGTRMRMSFRRRWHDKERGYTGYFWKAVPQGTENA